VHNGRPVIKLNKLFWDYDNTRGKDFGYSISDGKRKKRNEKYLEGEERQNSGDKEFSPK